MKLVNIQFENNLCVRGENIVIPLLQFVLGRTFQVLYQVSSILTKQLIYFCNYNPNDLFESFVDALDGLATQKTQMEQKFLDFEAKLKSSFNQLLSTFNQLLCRKDTVMQFGDKFIRKEQQEISTHFTKTKEPFNWLERSFAKESQSFSSPKLQQRRRW